MSRNEWTLTQIAKLLGQPQHKLIYLCEKGVILPDRGDARGRGSSRRFSARNLFEFMVAITLGDFHIPTLLTTRILRVLRSFEKHLGQSYPMLKLPYSLRIQDSPELKAILIEGSYLYFAIRKENEPEVFIGGLDLLNKNNISMSLDTANPLSVKRVEGLPNKSKIAKFELNLSQLAKEVPLS